jgi:hypothetical protein
MVDPPCNSTKTLEQSLSQVVQNEVFVSDTPSIAVSQNSPLLLFNALIYDGHPYTITRAEARNCCIVLFVCSFPTDMRPRRPMSFQPGAAKPFESASQAPVYPISPAIYDIHIQVSLKSSTLLE